MTETGAAPPYAELPVSVPLRVVATAGHVDHGKSALVLRLTGMDPDRLAEEKRRGLTIDLGFAWTTLPSGAEVGFVDVPGHERFVANMLAGVGPVRLVLFVVAADEGWKPQSEEHFQILDVLGVEGAVVALTKRDLVDEQTARLRIEEVRERVAGTRMGAAPIVPCSSTTGEGLDAVRTALDALLSSAPPPVRDERPRLFVDRVFSIRGSGTVVTGTLVGGPLSVGQEVEARPSGHRARIRGLQTHKRALSRALPVSRVAVNLAATTTRQIERGDVLAPVGAWRPTARFDAWIRPVRGLAHSLTARGAYKLHAGSAERDARLRLYETKELRPDRTAFARISLSRPVVLDVHDPFVLREAGRRQTVAGGLVLDVEPPVRPGTDVTRRLEARTTAAKGDLPRLLVSERRAVRASDIAVLTGLGAERALERGAVRLGAFVLDPAEARALQTAATDLLARHHEAHPLSPGAEVVDVRAILAERANDPALVDAVVEHLVATGTVVREGSALRLATRRFTTRGRDDVDRLVETVTAAGASPPSIAELGARGFPPEVVTAAVTDRRLVRVSRDLVFAPGTVEAAEWTARQLAQREALTVSAFREAMGTSRKYALPLLEHFDAIGLTRRSGDLRVLRRA